MHINDYDPHWRAHERGDKLVDQVTYQRLLNLGFTPREVWRLEENYVHMSDIAEAAERGYDFVLAMLEVC